MIAALRKPFAILPTSSSHRGLRSSSYKVINAIITFVIGHIVIILELIGWTVSVALLAYKTIKNQKALVET